MISVLVDTNVLVSFLVDRNPQQQAQAAELFAGAVRGEHQVILHQAALFELVYVLGNFYERPKEEVAAILRDLLGMPGTAPLDDMPWPLLLDIWPKPIAAFADAVLVAVAKQGKLDRLATFDGNLAKAARRLGVASFWRQREP